MAAIPMAPPPIPRAAPSQRSGAATSYPFYFGGLAVSMASTCTHPLDLAKVRMQTLPGKPGLRGTLAATVADRGFIGLFDGLSAAWFRGMSYSLVRFQTYETSKQYLQESGKINSALGTSVLAGFSAGIVGGFVSNPGDIVLIRMQADHSRALADRFAYKNVLHGLYSIGRNEGLEGLFRGLSTTLVRAVLTNVGQLASYDLCKSALLSFGQKDTPTTQFVASFAAGTITTTISQPADVVRSRIMSMHTPASPIKVATDLVRREGPASLFKGFLPTWYRITPQTVLTFLFLEQLRGLWRKM